jgi:hypothetical protein
MKVLMHIIQMKSPGSMGPDPWNTSAAIKSQIVFSRPNIEDIPVGILCMNSPYGMEIQYCSFLLMIIKKIISNILPIAQCYILDL